MFGGHRPAFGHRSVFGHRWTTLTRLLIKPPAQLTLFLGEPLQLGQDTRLKFAGFVPPASLIRELLSTRSC